MNPTPRSVSAAMPLPAQITNAAEAEALTVHFAEVMDALVAIVRQETEFLRTGRIGQATQLGDAKAELTRLYLADALRLRASQTLLARAMPDKLETLRTRHDGFRALLQISLTVIATAHAVSEGIVRGVSGEMARKAAPQTYGASGRPNLPGRNAAPALAISRVL